MKSVIFDPQLRVSHDFFLSMFIKRPTSGSKLNTQNKLTDILEQFDHCAKQFQFPMLDNGYVYLADTRLTAYAAGPNWGVSIETLGVSTRAAGLDGITNALYCFGNQLKERPGLTNNRFLYPVLDGPTGPLFAEDGYDRIRLEARDISIREAVVPLSTAPEYYETRGIMLIEPSDIYAFEMLRGLVPDFRDSLLATDEELQRQFPIALPPLIQLDEWRHPDLIAGEMPSECETFQQIAQVIARQNPTVYQPTKQPNTHWRNWPEGGTL